MYNIHPYAHTFCMKTKGMYLASVVYTFSVYLDDERVLLPDGGRVLLEVVQGLGQEGVESGRDQGHDAVQHQRVVLQVRVFPVHLIVGSSFAVVAGENEGAGRGGRSRANSPAITTCVVLGLRCGGQHRRSTSARPLKKIQRENKQRSAFENKTPDTEPGKTEQNR